MAFDLIEVLKKLAVQRPVFHSEADFQHALGWNIHERYPDAKVRLEYRPGKLKDKAYIDIWVEIHRAVFAIELKYKTCGLQVTFGDELFNLLGQSAQDQARYDFCRDIHRIEMLAGAYAGLTGFALFLTNDKGYWRASARDANVDSAFRVHENSKLSGRLDWASHASDGTKSGRASAICLIGEYLLNWVTYSKCGDGRNSEFRMTLVNTRASLGRADKDNLAVTLPIRLATGPHKSSRISLSTATNPALR
jgi:hypothetical protein